MFIWLLLCYYVIVGRLAFAQELQKPHFQIDHESGKLDIKASKDSADIEYSNDNLDILLKPGDTKRPAVEPKEVLHGESKSRNEFPLIKDPRFNYVNPSGNLSSADEDKHSVEDIKKTMKFTSKIEDAFGDSSKDKTENKNLPIANDERESSTKSESEETTNKNLSENSNNNKSESSSKDKGSTKNESEGLTKNESESLTKNESESNSAQPSDNLDDHLKKNITWKGRINDKDEMTDNNNVLNTLNELKDLVTVSLNKTLKDSSNLEPNSRFRGIEDETDRLVDTKNVTYIDSKDATLNDANAIISKLEKEHKNETSEFKETHPDDLFYVNKAKDILKQYHNQDENKIPENKKEKTGNSNDDNKTLNENNKQKSNSETSNIKSKDDNFNPEENRETLANHTAPVTTKANGNNNTRDRAVEVTKSPDDKMTAENAHNNVDESSRHQITKFIGETFGFEPATSPSSSDEKETENGMTSTSAKNKDTKNPEQQSEESQEIEKHVDAVAEISQNSKRNDTNDNESTDKNDVTSNEAQHPSTNQDISSPKTTNRESAAIQNTTNQRRVDPTTLYFHNVSKDKQEEVTSSKQSQNGNDEVQKNSNNIQTSTLEGQKDPSQKEGQKERDENEESIAQLKPVNKAKTNSTDTVNVDYSSRDASITNHTSLNKTLTNETSALSKEDSAERAYASLDVDLDAINNETKQHEQQMNSTTKEIPSDEDEEKVYASIGDKNLTKSSSDDDKNSTNNDGDVHKDGGEKSDVGNHDNSDQSKSTENWKKYLYKDDNDDDDNDNISEIHETRRRRKIIAWVPAKLKHDEKARNNITPHKHHRNHVNVMLKKFLRDYMEGKSKKYTRGKEHKEVSEAKNVKETIENNKENELELEAKIENLETAESKGSTEEALNDAKQLAQDVAEELQQTRDKLQNANLLLVKASQRKTKQKQHSAVATKATKMRVKKKSRHAKSTRKNDRKMTPASKSKSNEHNLLYGGNKLFHVTQNETRNAEDVLKILDIHSNNNKADENMSEKHQYIHHTYHQHPNNRRTHDQNIENHDQTHGRSKSHSKDADINKAMAELEVLMKEKSNELKKNAFTKETNAISRRDQIKYPRSRVLKIKPSMKEIRRQWFYKDTKEIDADYFVNNIRSFIKAMPKDEMTGIRRAELKDATTNGSTSKTNIDTSSDLQAIEKALVEKFIKTKALLWRRLHKEQEQQEDAEIRSPEGKRNASKDRNEVAMFTKYMETNKDLLRQINNLTLQKLLTEDTTSNTKTDMLGNQRIVNKSLNSKTHSQNILNFTYPQSFFRKYDSDEEIEPDIDDNEKGRASDELRNMIAITSDSSDDGAEFIDNNAENVKETANNSSTVKNPSREKEHDTNSKNTNINNNKNNVMDQQNNKTVVAMSGETSEDKYVIPVQEDNADDVNVLSDGKKHTSGTQDKIKGKKEHHIYFIVNDSDIQKSTDETKQSIKAIERRTPHTKKVSKQRDIGNTEKNGFKNKVENTTDKNTLINDMMTRTKNVNDVNSNMNDYIEPNPKSGSKENKADKTEEYKANTEFTNTIEKKDDKQKDVGNTEKNAFKNKVENTTDENTLINEMMTRTKNVNDVNSLMNDYTEPNPKSGNKENKADKTEKYKGHSVKTNTEFTDTIQKKNDENRLATMTTTTSADQSHEKPTENKDLDTEAQYFRDAVTKLEQRLKKEESTKKTINSNNKTKEIQDTSIKQPTTTDIKTNNKTAALTLTNDDERNEEQRKEDPKVEHKSAVKNIVNPGTEFSIKNESQQAKNILKEQRDQKNIGAIEANELEDPIDNSLQKQSRQEDFQQETIQQLKTVTDMINRKYASIADEESKPLNGQQNADQQSQVSNKDPDVDVKGKTVNDIATIDAVNSSKYTEAIDKNTDQMKSSSEDMEKKNINNINMSAKQSGNNLPIERTEQKADQIKEDNRNVNVQNKNNEESKIKSNDDLRVQKQEQNTEQKGDNALTRLEAEKIEEKLLKLLQRENMNQINHNSDNNNKDANNVLENKKQNTDKTKLNNGNRAIEVDNNKQNAGQIKPNNADKANEVDNNIQNADQIKPNNADKANEVDTNEQNVDQIKPNNVGKGNNNANNSKQNIDQIKSNNIGIADNAVDNNKQNVNLIRPSSVAENSNINHKYDDKEKVTETEHSKQNAGQTKDESAQKYLNQIAKNDNNKAKTSELDSRKNTEQIQQSREKAKTEGIDEIADPYTTFKRSKINRYLQEIGK